MSKFINLSSCLINKLHIVEIIKQPSKYSIYLTNSHFSGAMFVASDHISSTSNIIEVCENKNPQDYKIITNWIKNMPPI
jgi:hypothetical protein